MGSWYVFYFMFVVFFGSFYLINLVLAVVAVSYQQEVVAMQERVRNVVPGDTLSCFVQFRQCSRSYKLRREDR